MLHRSLAARFAAAIACAGLYGGAAIAQSQPAPPAAARPHQTKAGVAKPAPPSQGRACTRLPLSDIQVGREKTIEIARLRLDEYMAKVGAKRGWKSWDKSQETITCDEYLFVPFLGQEYKCMVTATFCRKG